MSTALRTFAEGRLYIVVSGDGTKTSRAQIVLRKTWEAVATLRDNTETDVFLADLTGADRDEIDDLCDELCEEDEE
jgi:tRNA U55 pseudouridine synthase TruB